MNDIKIFKIILENALDTLYEKDSILIRQGCNERTIVSRLAHYMILEDNNVKFEPPYAYDIDVEYNRKGTNIGKTKMIQFIKENKLRSILPDIIFHKRNEEVNLAVIEIKVNKTTIKKINKDIEKIKLLTSNEDYLYKIGAFINISQDKTTITYIKNKEIEIEYEYSPKTNN